MQLENSGCVGSVLKVGRRGGAVVGTVASQQGGPEFNSLVIQGALLCGACLFSPCMHGFYSGTPVSSHSLKAYGLGQLAF